MRSPPPRAARLLATVPLLALLAACDEDASADPPPDAAFTPDAAPDSALDAAPPDGTPPDAALDAAPDAAPGPTVTWLAGGSTTGFVDGVGPAARFSGVTCIALVDGTLYASDTFNGTVRAIALATGAVTTLAGRPLELAAFDGSAGQARFESPRGCAATDAALWIADGPTVRRLDLTDRSVTTIAGAAGQRGDLDAVGSAARFGFLIHDIEPGPDGALLLADRINDALRRLDPATGAVTSLLRDGLNGPGGLARDGDALYVADTFDGELLRVPLAGGEAEVIADGFDTPQGLAVADGIAWIMGFDGLLHRVALDTGDVTLALGVPGEAFARDGDAATARLGGSFASPVIAPDGALYFVDLDSSAIRRVALDTLAVTTLAGPVEPAGYRDGPAPLFGTLYDVVAGDGGWIVSDPDNHAVRVVDAAGAARTLFGHPDTPATVDGPLATARIESPVGLARDGERLYVADYAGAIRVVEDGAVTTLADGLDTPWGLGLGPDGRLYVTEIESGAVKAIDRDGAVTVLAPPGTFDAPTDVAVDAEGRVYVADESRAAVYGLRPAGSPIVIVGRPGVTGVRDGTLGEALLGGPVGLTFADDGALIIVDGPNHLLRRLDLAAGRIERWLGHPVRHGNRPPGAVVPRDEATFHAPQAVALAGARAAVVAEQGISVAEGL
ncbi:MAG: hypothetical protein H6703_10600 [Myxococcales bacterium]|nr:hypothetical protein [Myxococcales bacterium]